MGELVIKNHDFEDAKLAIKEFSEQTTTDLDLKRVDDKKRFAEWIGDAIFGGGLGTNHRVTGEELNELTVQIQSHFKSVNSTQIKLIKEFGQVYSALEALDKDYIQAILISIKATEETSKRIEVTQEQIKKIVEDQKKTLEILKKFKRKLDSYAHLGDIDKIWNDCQKWNAEIPSISDTASEAVSSSKENTKAIDSIKESIEDIDSKITLLSKTVNEQIARIESIITFLNEFDDITHLKDIDTMWDSLSNAHISLEKLCDEMTTLIEQSDNTAKSVKENQTAIAGLNEYRQELSDIAHLKDVDNLWDASEKHSKQIEELQSQGEELKNLILHNKELTDHSLAAEKEKTDAVLQQLNKKIQYAYWIAGGSMVLALVELFVILLG